MTQWKCKDCGAVYFTDPSACSNCGSVDVQEVEEAEDELE